jgi:hypothetical protein
MRHAECCAFIYPAEGAPSGVGAYPGDAAMGLIVTRTGDAGKYLIRGAIWELGASSYRAYVHLVPTGSRLDLFEYQSCR